MRTATTDETTKVEEVPGEGVWFTDRSHARWALGRAGWASHEESEGHDGHTVLSCDGVVVARFQFRDALRPDAVAQVTKLQAGGKRVLLLSGDHQAKVSALARCLSIPESDAYGEASPTRKAAIVSTLDDRDTLYIGDGLNDCLAFPEALCTATPVIDKGLLAAKADFYFLSPGLRFFDHLSRTAARREKAVRRVVRFSILYNVAAAGFSLAGMMNPLIASIIMPLSSLVTLAIVGLHFRRSAGTRRIPAPVTPPAGN